MESVSRLELISAPVRTLSGTIWPKTLRDLLPIEASIRWENISG
jgi:hypothetical protein